MNPPLSANEPVQSVISTIEEVDPDPEPRFKRHVWEALLGILLLVGILLWAGWQWWDRETAVERKAAEHSALMQKAVAGTIAVRPEAEPPGLYYWGEDGWVWLKGSDARSRLASKNYRHVIYDIPGPGWSPRVSLTPETNQEDFEKFGSPGLRGRRLVIAGFDESNRLRFDELTFDPVKYDYYYAGEKGVWARRLSDDVSASTPVRDLTLDDLSFDYQARGSQLVSSVALPGPTWSTEWLHPDGERLLLAEDVADAEETNLYMAQADGSAPTWVYSYTGYLEVDFSHDGRYALLRASKGLGGGESQQRLLWLDLLGQMPPKLLAEQIMDETETRGIYRTGVAGGFVRGGPNGERIFIAEKPLGSKDVTVRMLDASNPEKELLTVPLDDTFLGWISWSRDPKTSVEALFILKDMARDGADKSLSGVFVTLFPGRSPVISTASLGRGFPVNGLYVNNGQLAYMDINDGKDTLYTMPLPHENSTDLQVTSVFTSTERMEFTGSHTPYFFGPELFAYVDDGNLYAQSYDGTSNLLLENGVTELSWGLRPETILRQFR